MNFSTFAGNKKTNIPVKKTVFLLFILSIGYTSFAQKYRAIITTDYGKIELMLYDKTPKHRDNFAKLSKKHFYDGTLFHRVIPEFMIQGGDPNSKNAAKGAMLGDGDAGYTIPAEFVYEYYHKCGALAAARDNNPDKASSGCQFYIVVGKKYKDEELDNMEKRTGKKYTAAQRETYKSIGGTPFLDNNYTVYGEVTKGMDIVYKIASMPRDAHDRPNDDQRMQKVRVKKKFLFLWL